MATCKDCLHYEVCCKLIGKDKIDRASWMCHFPDDCSEFKCTTPKTNDDRMNAMSIEEKARFLTAVCADGCPPKMDWDCAKDEAGWDACDACWCNWLQQPAEDN